MPIHIHKVIECNAPASEVFAYASDYRNVADWLYGISKFEPVGDLDHGLGAVFDGSMHLGVTLTSRLQVVEWEQGTRFVFDSIKGFRNWSTWTFEDIADGRSVIRADVSYELPGGIAGKAMGKVMEPFVKIAVTRSSEAIARNVHKA